MRIRPWIGYGFSFLLPIAFLAIVASINDLYPFGEHLVIIGDFYHQYQAYFQHWLAVLREGESLTYSFNAGFGGSFYGIFAYYVASPFTWILALFPKDAFILSVTIMVTTKIASAGVTSALYLRYTFRELRWVEVLGFSTLYSLMNYSILNYSNPMWLDGYIFLPVLILLVDRLLKYEKWISFSILLALMFVANFYIGYMVGVFLLLYVFVHLTSRTQFFVFLKAVIIAILLSAFLWVPTAYLLSIGQNAVAKDWFNVSLVQFLSLLMAGRQGNDFFFEGAFHVSLLVWLLVPLFVLVRSIPAVTKWRVGLLLSFYLLAVSFYPFDKVLHGFATPHGFPYRYGFIISFILWVAMIIVYKRIPELSFRLVGGIYIIALVVMGFVTWKDEAMVWNEWLINAIIITLFLGFLWYKKNHNQRWMTLLLCLSIGSNLLYNTFLSEARERANVGTITFDDYHNALKWAPLLQKIQNKNTSMGIYRVDSAEEDNYNGFWMMGFPSFLNSSSFITKSAEDALFPLGLSTGKASYGGYGSTPFSKLLLGERYYLTSEGAPDGDYYRLVAKDGKLEAYENTLALGVGIETTSRIEEVVYKNHYPLENQEAVAYALTGKYVSLYRQIPWKQIELKNVKRGYKGWYVQTGNESIKGTYKVFPTRGDSPALVIGVHGRETEVDLTVDGQDMRTQGRIVHRGIDVTSSSDSPQWWVYLVKGREWKDPVGFYETTPTTMKDVRDNMPEQTFQIDHVKGNTLLGRGNGSKEKNRLVLTIPYEKGWKATINGKEVAPRLVLGGWMVIDIPEGPYDLELTYTLVGQQVGWILTCVGLLGLVWLHLRERRREDERGIINRGAGLQRRDILERSDSSD